MSRCLQKLYCKTLTKCIRNIQTLFSDTHVVYDDYAVKYSEVWIECYLYKSVTVSV